METDQSPDAEVPPELAEHLRGLELSLLDPTVRASRETVERLLAEDFLEFGTSGRTYDKQAILTSLASETPSVVNMSHFQAKGLGTDVVLATFATVRLDGDGKPVSRSLRSSIWQYLRGRWQIVFHQGTRVPLEPQDD